MPDTTGHMSISLDGFVAGPDQSREDPLGKRELELHGWHIGDPRATDAKGIIVVYEAGEADGVPFIAMHLAEGGDVQALINQRRQLPVGQVCDIVAAIAPTLDAVHGHGAWQRQPRQHTAGGNGRAGPARPCLPDRLRAQPTRVGPRS